MWFPILSLQEKGKRVDEEFMSDKFADGYRMFMKYYTPWLKSTALDKETHPWAGFQKPARDRRNKKEHTQDDIQHTEVNTGLIGLFQTLFVCHVIYFSCKLFVFVLSPLPHLSASIAAILIFFSSN